MERCQECLCVPAECGAQCAVCSEERCCTSVHTGAFGRIKRFFSYSKEMFAAALGIEIICISFAELGESVGLYAFGFNPAGIVIAYATGYALAGAATFVTILGRHGNSEMLGCCSVEHSDKKGFVQGLSGTLRDFARGGRKLVKLHREPELKSILKASAVILVTAESACILVAETVGIVLYQYSILLSVPLALAAGAFAIVAPAAYRKAKR